VDRCVAQTDDGVQSESDLDLIAQPAPDYQVDQRVNLRLTNTPI
jgi:hypothetical protein